MNEFASVLELLQELKTPVRAKDIVNHVNKGKVSLYNEIKRLTYHDEIERLEIKQEGKRFVAVAYRIKKTN